MGVGNTIYKASFSTTDTDLWTVEQPAWVTNKNAPTTIDILTQLGRIKTTGTAVFGYGDFGEGKLLTRTLDFEMRCDFQFLNVAEQYIAFGFRRGLADNATQGDSPVDGYYVELDHGGANQIHVVSAAASVQTPILDINGVVFANATWYTIIVRCAGPRLQAKVFATGSEPYSWQMDQIDRTHWIPTGREYVSIGTLGGAGNGVDCLFRNFSVKRFYEGDLLGLLNTKRVSSGTAYTDSVTTTAVMDTGNSTDSRGMTESLVTTGVGVSSVPGDTLTANDSPVTTGVGVTSNVNTLTMDEIISTTAVVSTGLIDTVSGFESVASTGVGSTSLVDTLTFNEFPSSTAVGSTSIVDTAGYTETPTTIGVGSTSLPVDTLTANESPVTTAAMLTGEVDQLAMYETPVSTGVGVTSQVDSLGMFEFPVTVGVGTTSESDRSDMQDALLTIGVGVTSETDVMNGTPTPGVGITYFGSMIINKS